MLRWRVRTLTERKKRIFSQIKIFSLELFSQGIITNQRFYYENGKEIYYGEPEFSGIASPTELDILLKPTFSHLDKDVAQYFVSLGVGLSKPFWTIICFDSELDIAGHIVTSRIDGKISFAQYADITNPKPNGFIPKVGIICIQTKDALQNSVDSSFLFQMFWTELKVTDDNDCTFLFVKANEINQPFLKKLIEENHSLWEKY